MIEKICNFLVKKMKEKTPDMTEEREEIINYGLQLIIGEIPKTFALLIIAYICGVLELSILALLVMIPYRMVSGGVHLKSHIGCIVSTTIFYTGNALISKNLVLDFWHKIVIIAFIWIISMIAIKKYAPADTEEVPILREKERKIKKYLSYLFMTLTLGISLLIKNEVISNLLMFGTLMQTIMITRLVYKISNCKYGYEEYKKANQSA